MSDKVLVYCGFEITVGCNITKMVHVTLHGTHLCASSGATFMCEPSSPNSSEGLVANKLSGIDNFGLW